MAAAHQSDNEDDLLVGFPHLKWVNIADYKCVRCSAVLVRHFMPDDCDHKFCFNCQRVLSKKEKNWTCKVCAKHITGLERRDDQFAERVQQLLVHCPKPGCEYICPFKDLKEHLEAQHKKENNKNEGARGKQDAPPEMATGLRNESTEMMRLKMTEMEEEMLDDKARLKSVDEKVNSFASGLLLEVTKLKEETSQLKEEISNIKASEEEHKDKTMQLESKCQLLMEQLLEKKDKNNGITTARIEPEMTCFDLNNGNSKHTRPDVEWQLPNGRESEWFKWRSYPVLGRVKIGQDYWGHPSLSLQLEYQNEDKFTQDWKLIPNVYYRLRNTHENAVITDSICVNAFHSFGKNNGQPLSFNHTLTHLRHRDNLVNQLLKVYIEPPAMAQMVHSYDGTLNWTVDNYAQRKRMEREGLIEYQESPYFYTGPSGYRVRLQMYLDGVGKSKRSGVTAQISFLSGEFDAELSGDFPHRTTITLLNGNDPEFNVIKIAEKNMADEKSYAVDLCDVKETLFALQNDALTFKVVIEPM